ncbi:MAG: hypothetical protein FJ117_13270 [Deltaproteobacteria bacterium]|nr:hypothetical protein [Deltaproteobacteria bacterium]
MKICTTCVLPETFPGITFDDQGRCSYCSKHDKTEKRDNQRDRFYAKFQEILQRLKGKDPYDALLAYSGGKDSTYTLKLLKETYGLKLLAITVDHGFVSPKAVKNIQNVTGRLDIDHCAFRPGTDTLRTLFSRSMVMDVYPIKALERASAICNSCMNLVKSLLIKISIEMRVPMIFYGWSPGQAPLRSSVFKTNAAMLRKMQEAVSVSFEKLIGDRLSAYLLKDHHFKTDPSRESDRFPYIIHPLAFLDYSEETILDAVGTLGWIPPEDTGSNSSNCLLNDFAIEMHIKQHRFHPYAFEIAGLVREGCMTRSEGLERLSSRPDAAHLDYIKKKLEAGAESRSFCKGAGK